MSIDQKLELARQEFQLPRSPLGIAGEQIQFDRTQSEPDLRQVAGATQEGLDAGEQLVEREGFDKIVVAAGTQPFDTLIHPIERTEDKRRGPTPLRAMARRMSSPSPSGSIRSRIRMSAGAEIASPSPMAAVLAQRMEYP